MMCLMIWILAYKKNKKKTMRKTYITKEYIDCDVYGTYNMRDVVQFFGSNMMKIEDEIEITNNTLLYYQQTNHEQINILNEQNITSAIFSVSNEKKTHHTLLLDDTQTDYQMQNMTLWTLDIDLYNILVDYLFASIKKSRAFEGFKNYMSLSTDVDNDIIDYIKYNIIDRYVFKKIDLYINYTSLLKSTSGIQFKNTWKPLPLANKVSNYNMIMSNDKKGITLKFAQRYPSQTHNFEYYYNLFFSKL